MTSPFFSLPSAVGLPGPAGAMEVHVLSRMSAVARLLDARRNAEANAKFTVTVHMGGRELFGVAGIDEAVSLVRRRAAYDFQLFEGKTNSVHISINRYARMDVY